MTRLHPIAAFFLFLLMLVPAQAASKKASDRKSIKVGQELARLYKQWDKALVDADLAVLRIIMADEILMTSGDGSTMDKEANLAALRTKRLVIAAAETSEIRVTAYGDTAVAVGVWKSTQRSGARELTVSNRFTDTWVRRNGRWQCVANHISPIR